MIKVQIDFGGANRPMEEGLFHYFQQCIQSLKAAGRLRTSATYRQTLLSLRHYRQEVDLPLDEITSTFAVAYEGWLRSRHLCRNSTSFYMRILRAVYNRAVRDGLTPDRQPFREVYTGIDRTAKRALTAADIHRIRTADLSDDPQMAFARDMFILSFFLRGIAPIDLSLLLKSDLNCNFLTYCRRKTGQSLTIRIEPSIQAILDRYPCPDSPYLLPLIRKADGTELQQYRSTTQTVNRNLRKLATRLNIHQQLTLYVARHSWASIAQANQVPLSVISGAMGHDSERTTQIYLSSILTEDIDKVNQMIMKRV